MGEVGSIASLSQESTHAPFIGIGRGSGAARLHAFTPPFSPTDGHGQPAVTLLFLWAALT